ncbi:MAG: ComF family protein [Phycisphaerae bacterium]|nr:ComF family protein [Phycisphaerae bacterium]
MSSGGGFLKFNFGGKLQSFARGVLDLVIPQVCGGCGQAVPVTMGLCGECNLKLLSLVGLPYCKRCGSTLGPNIPEYPDGCSLCPNPIPRFGSVARLGPYTGLLRYAIHQLKYRDQLGMARRLGRMLGESISETDTPHRTADVIVPIPMHWLRRISRPSDHSAVLARSLGRGLKIPVERLLKRVRNTPPQVHITRTQRFANIRGAFSPVKGRSLAGVHVLLVDDVTTTGATAGEAARMLLAAGASRVSLCVIAKAEPSRAYTQHWGEA